MGQVFINFSKSLNKNFIQTSFKNLEVKLSKSKSKIINYDIFCTYEILENPYGKKHKMFKKT